MNGHGSSRILFSAILCALVTVAVALTWVRSRQDLPKSVEPTQSSPVGRISQDLAAQLARLETRERMVDETAWAKEMLAQNCGRTIESLWDSINSSSNKLGVVAAFPVGAIVLGKWNPPRELPHGIELRESAGAGPVLSGAEWRGLVEGFRRDGWELVQTEFRHVRFDTDAAGAARQSHFYFSAHLADRPHTNRAVLEGDLVIEWDPSRAAGGEAAVRRVDASGLRIQSRPGEPAFQPILREKITPRRTFSSVDPLILYDLDGDGFSEIILAAQNVVYRRRGEGRYEPEPLCKFPPTSLSAAVMADFDGDGNADLLCVTLDGLVLFKGSPGGTFDGPGELAWPTTSDLKFPMVLTCGDIDHDGDLDIFLAQYKLPYEGGQMPTPDYDANDGHPAYLLLNDGHGKFADATSAAGLEKKRRRRTYSASFADVDNDGNLDLVVVSDFAGIDVYQNAGRGHFRDVTGDWIPDQHAFGMSLAVADFNRDGQLDLLMIGMTSPTVERLEHLDLWRPDVTEDRTMRSRMTFGNRLYLARPGGGFQQTGLGNSIARTGWSWGCTAQDFDNDGWPDVYIANGMESKKSVADYESHYWLHDRYVATSNEDPLSYIFLKSEIARQRGHGESYGGYEKNRLFLNEAGQSFLEAGYLMGVGLEQDSRNVVADDLDGDGRVDLLVTAYEDPSAAQQILVAYKNNLNDSGNWIGFRFREEGGGISPVGVRVTVRFDNAVAVGQIVTGDSYRSQSSNTLHFGLGKAKRVETVDVRWPGGESVTLHDVEVNRYYLIHPKPKTSPQP